MKRREFLKFAAGSAAGMLLNGCSAPLVNSAGSNRKPNIIFIMADDLGYHDLGCYGSRKIPTPNCDRLANEGMKFTDAHSPSAVCTPTRYGVLTGQYCWRTWLKDWVINDRMPLLIEEGRLTVPAMLKQYGYTTGCIGKWHLGWGRRNDAYQKGIMEPGPLEVGFDSFFGVPFSHNSPPTSEVFVRGRSIVGMKDGESIMDKAVFNRCRRKLPDTAMELSAEAVRFIENNKDKPFFLYYPTTNVHLPHTPNERFRGRSSLGEYGDFVVEFDWAVGEVLNALERLNLTNNTLIIVTSDNGSRNSGSNLPWRGAKAQIYEGGHRVPFIARWPGKINHASTCDETICLTDLMATCAELMGLALPHNVGEDSESFLPALYGKKLSRQREAIVHHSVCGMFAIRQGKWKLIEGLGHGGDFNFGVKLYDCPGLPRIDEKTGKVHDLSFEPKPFPQPAPDEPLGQLYDIDADPGETKNVWQEQPEVVRRLQKLLDKYRRYGRSRR